VLGWGRFRAQSIGELLDSAFTVYRRRFLVIVAVMAVFQLPYLAVQLLGERSALSTIASLQTGSPTAAQLEAELGNLAAAAVTVLAISVAYALFLLPIAQGAVIRVVGDDYLDRTPGIGSALAMAFRRGGALIGFGLLVLAIILVPLGLILLLGVLVGGAAGVGLILLLGIAWAVYFVIFGVRLSLGAQAVVLERTGPVAALRRSFALTAGSFWRIVLFYVIVNVVSSIVSELLGLLIGLFTGGLSPGSQLLVSALASGIIGLLTSPFLLILLTLVYYDVRIRREAFDLEMLARSL
jgi:hypothetical protein